MRTEQAYVDWACRYILFHGKRQPKDMGAAEIEAFLTMLLPRARCPPPPRTKITAGCCSRLL
ncbi:MAG: phage integrase N-terminal SAM-like domain-containing protein [Gammaproteobacteria bacterium]